MEYTVLKINDSHHRFNELINNLSNLFDVDGVWDHETGTDIYVNSAKGPENIEKIKAYLHSGGIPSQNIRVESFADDGIDWNAEWKKNYKPVRIKEQLWVYPSWIPVPETLENAIVIKIEPQMGFGTGTHETTQMMMHLLAEMSISPTSVLDLGTGSGILAIQAEKQFPKTPILAMDIDPDAIDNAMLNGKLNHCENIEWKVGTLEPINTRFFELILANINRSVLVDLIPDLWKRLLPNGTMILSGILTEEMHLIEKVCEENRLRRQTVIQKNEWSAAIWEKQQ